jgi:hypothetical protein
MPKMIIKASGVPLVNGSEANDLARSLGASSHSATLSGTFSQYDIVFHFDSTVEGNEAISILGEDSESYIEYSDGTIGRHYVRYERNNFDD